MGSSVDNNLWTHAPRLAQNTARDISIHQACFIRGGRGEARVFFGGKNHLVYGRIQEEKTIETNICITLPSLDI